MKIKKVFLLFFSLFFIITPSKGQNKDSLLSDKTIRALNNEISGELAQDYIRHIAQFRRDQGSDEYHHAAEWVANTAKKAGLHDVHIERYPADGQTYYYMYKSRLAWDIDFAELWVVEPQEEKLTSYAEIPVSIARYSHSCDVKGELIYVGNGTSAKDYENVDVKGKIVVAEGNAGSVAGLAVDQYGALGVVNINKRFAYDEPDNVSRLHLDTKTPTFAFGLSHRRGEALRDRLINGEELVARALVKARVHPGNYENVIATIPGTDLKNEEILFTAHLCHYKPGANDNASGSACLLEIGRALRRLIDEGKIKQPRRTIRFLWVPEMSGSIAYAAKHPDIIKKMVAGINLDMVGQYLNKNNATFFLHRTPHSQPHFINDLLTNITEFVAANNVQALIYRGGFPHPVLSLSGSRDAFRYRIFPYVGGSDQWIFNDSLLGVPSVFFLVWPDRYYHTSGDKPEICDPTQLKRSSFIAAAATTYLMDDCPHKARKLAGEVFLRANARIDLEVKRSFDLMNKTRTDSLHVGYKEGLNIIEQAYQREISTLESVKNYSHRDVSVDEYIKVLINQMAAKKKESLGDLENFYTLSCRAYDVSPQKITLTTEEQDAKNIVPSRNPDLKGPIGRGYLEEKLEGMNMELPIFQVDRRMTYEILNFIDGKNSLLDIRNAVSAEYEPVPVKWIQAFIELLSKAGIVSMDLGSN
jgi:hypothetical protein